MGTSPVNSKVIAPTALRVWLEGFQDTPRKASPQRSRAPAVQTQPQGCRSEYNDAQCLLKRHITVLRASWLTKQRGLLARRPARRRLDATDKRSSTTLSKPTRTASEAQSTDLHVQDTWRGIATSVCPLGQSIAGLWGCKWDRDRPKAAQDKLDGTPIPRAQYKRLDISVCAL